MATVANVNQFGFDIGGVAVVGEADRIGCPISQQLVLRAHLPQPAGFHTPAQVGAHQAIVANAVNRELLAMRVCQAVFAGALQHELCCLVELGGCGNAMQAREISQVLIGRCSAGLVADGNPLR